MATCEDNVGLRLKRHLAGNPLTTILSYHPPDAKAYETDLIRIPKRGLRRVAARDRYHIDLIYVVGECLVFIELKCRLNESREDISKLLEIRDEYSLPELVQLIANRLTTVGPEALRQVHSLVLALGVEEINTAIPPEFAVFEVKESLIRLWFGHQVPIDVQRTVQKTLDTSA